MADLQSLLCSDGLFGVNSACQVERDGASTWRNIVQKTMSKVGSTTPTSNARQKFLDSKAKRQVKTKLGSIVSNVGGAREEARDCKGEANVITTGKSRPKQKVVFPLS